MMGTLSVFDMMVDLKHLTQLSAQDFSVFDMMVDLKHLKVRPHRTRSAAADCGLCPLRNVTF